MSSLSATGVLIAGLLALPSILQGGPPEGGLGSTTTDCPPKCMDRVTGGGWIVCTPTGGFANFGVGGGVHNGTFWGHLNYLDHDLDMHVKATAVRGYSIDPGNANCRIITYDVTIDGESGEAVVRVCDNGEPGSEDIFEIDLSNGYSAGGDLGGGQPGGGNIQLHKPDCD